MITFSENGKTELLKAFIAAQGEMENAKKSTKNDHFKSKYADLSSVADAVMEALGKHGLGVMQFPAYDDDGVHVETLLVHEGGGSMSHTLSLKPAAATAQGVGSTITYARRYSLMSICGVAPEDDDGNAASGITGVSKKFEKPKAEAAPFDAETDDEFADRHEAAILALKSVSACDTYYKANNAAIKGRLSPEIGSPLFAKLTQRRDSLLSQDAENPFDGE